MARICYFTYRDFGKDVVVDVHEEGLYIGRDVSLGWYHKVPSQYARTSRTHARIYKDVDGRVTLKDLNSTNGTFVNGARVDETELHDGDVVVFGLTTRQLRNALEVVVHI